MGGNFKFKEKKCVPGQDTIHTDTYTGLSEPSWKARWGHHKQNFKTESEGTYDCLSKNILNLKDLNVPYTLKYTKLSSSNNQIVA